LSLLTHISISRSPPISPILKIVDDYYDRDRPAYYAALAAVNKETHDLTGWLEYFTDGVAVSVNEIKEAILRLGLQGSKGFKNQVALSPKQMKIVEFINGHGQVTKCFLAPRPI